MGVYDQIKQAFQDLIAPEIRALQGEIKRLDEKLDGLRRENEGVRHEIEGLRREMGARFDALDTKFVAEIRRLDTRIDSLERELKVAIEVRERLAALEAKLAPR
jgi:predicted RNase H-like nuclease (RuvC/YqgF family)